MSPQKYKTFFLTWEVMQFSSLLHFVSANVNVLLHVSEFGFCNCSIIGREFLKFPSIYEHYCSVVGVEYPWLEIVLKKKH